MKYPIVLLISISLMIISDEVCGVSDLLSRAVSLSLKFNQRMLYHKALQSEVENSINILVNSNSEYDQIMKALLYIGCGELDHAHNLVQYMGGHDAVYIHSLLHRLEGRNVGENGMLGWSNADYWNDQVGQYHPSFPEISAYSKQLSGRYPTNDRVTRFGSKLAVPPAVVSSDLPTSSPGPTINRASTGTAAMWNPSIFLGLCMDAFRSNDESCIEYCEAVTTEEYRILLRKYTAKLGPQVAVSDSI